VLSIGITVSYLEGGQAAEANRLFSSFAKCVVRSLRVKVHWKQKRFPGIAVRRLATAARAHWGIRASICWRTDSTIGTIAAVSGQVPLRLSARVLRHYMRRPSTWPTRRCLEDSRRQIGAADSPFP